MPKSKHRRKRPKAPRHQPSPESLAVTTAAVDAVPDFAAVLAQAEAELAAEIAAADEDGGPGPGPFLDGSESGEEFDRVAQSLIEAVEAQLSANDPPEVAATLARLLAAGHDRDRAIAMIGTVMMIEMNEIMRNERLFDRALYANRLAALPESPDFD